MAVFFGLVVVAATIGWRYWRWSRARISARALSEELSSTTMPQIPLEDVEQIKAIFSQYPQDAEIAYLLAVAYRRAGQMTNAREALTRAEQLGFSPEDILRQHYLIQFQSGQIQDAQPHLLGLLQQGCSDAVAEEIYECLVKGYLTDLRLSEAMLCLDYWIEWRPRSVRARLLRAMVLEMALERSRLLAEYREILAIDPDCAEAHLAIGHLLLKSKDVLAAQEEFQRCLELDPQSMRARLGLATAQRQLGKPSLAKSLLRECLGGELSPDNQSVALAELGQLALEERNYKEAVDYLKHSLELSPDDSTARYAMGLALSRMGDKKVADAELERSRRLDSLDERLTDLMHEIIRRPADAATRCEAGEIMLELGKKRESLACLQSALRCDKWDPKTHEVLARYYAQEGQREMADRHLAWAKQAAARQSQEGGVSGRAP